MIHPNDLMIHPVDSVDIHRFVQALASVLLGLFVGFSIALIISPDPTGLFPIVVGLILTAVLAVIFYVGIDKLTPSKPE